MPNIYKGKNYDEMLVSIRLMKWSESERRVKYGEAYNYFKNVAKMDAVAYLFHLAYHYSLVESIAAKSIILKDGELDKQNLDKISGTLGLIDNKAKNGANYNSEINKLAGVFGTSTGGDIGKLAGIAAISTAIFPNPVTGLIAGTLSIVAGVWNILTSAGKTASYEARERIRKFFSDHANYVNYPATNDYQKAYRTLIYLSHHFCRPVDDARPKCVAGTEACELEHFRYSFRADLHRNAWLSLKDIYSRYFVTFDAFKKFVDDYNVIVATINNIDPTNTANKFSDPLPTNNQTQQSGIGLLLLGTLPFLPKILGK